MTLFSQACDADTEVGLGTLGAELPVSPRQATPSFDDDLDVGKNKVQRRSDYLPKKHYKRQHFSISSRLTRPPAARQTSFRLPFACKVGRVTEGLPPTPSASASVAGCESPAVPAKHRGVQERNSDEGEVGSEGRWLRVTVHS